jgi:hypothetical protein
MRPERGHRGALHDVLLTRGSNPGGGGIPRPGGGGGVGSPTARGRRTICEE